MLMRHQLTLYPKIKNTNRIALEEIAFSTIKDF